MSIQSAFQESGLPFPANAMNFPEDGWDGIADAKRFGEELWICCPYCFKKLIKILPGTKIHKMPYKCKGSKCKKEFIVNLE